MKKIQKTVIEAYDNHLYPSNLAIEELNPEADFSRSRLFSVMFGLMNKKDDQLTGSDFNGLKFDFGRGESNNETSHFDLTLAADVTGSGITFTLNFNTDLFVKKTAERILDNYITLLKELITDSAKKVTDYKIMTTSEEELLLKQWNCTEVDYSDQSCIHQLIERQVRKDPDRVAIRFQSTDISYRELNIRANKLAHYLLSLGITCGDNVAVMLEPSTELVIAVLASLKVGAAYVPINPKDPEARKKYIIEKAGVKTVLSPTFKDWDILGDMSEENPERPVQPNELAYIIFTSGTTGTPKGIEIEHQGVINVLEWMQSEYPLSAGDSTLFHTSFNFDASVLEYLWPLSVGARVVIPRIEERKNPVMIGKYAHKEQITFLQFVPEMLDSFLDAGLKGEFAKPGCLRYVISGASSLTRSLRDKFYSFLDCKFANHYGPTETTIDAITFNCEQKFVGKDVPIGRPIANTKVYILDQKKNPVPIGVVGEIYIDSPGLARGYLDQPEKTLNSFIPNPFSKNKNHRLYRTGDLGKYTGDGQIIFKGRIDHQVKIRGNRIELEEIEKRIIAHPGIKRAAVVVETNQNQEDFLVSYIETDRNLNCLVNRNNKKFWMYPLSQLPGAKSSMDQIHSGAWPDYFMGADVYLEYWNQIMTKFSKYQMALYNQEGNLVAVGNTLPIYWDGTYEGLPEGWDGGVKCAFSSEGIQPNTLMVLAGVVDSQYQNQGLGTLILKGFKMLAKGHNLEQVLVPVRPTGKVAHPEMTFTQWCQKRRTDGLLQDNWLRIHERIGGKILKIEPYSQYISAPLEDWEEWTGEKFTTSGEYYLKNTLQPVKINLEQRMGEYYDPCVWVEHTYSEDEVYEWNYLDGKEIQNHLRKYLPTYMIPFNYKFILEMPLNHSDKVDYRALPELGQIQHQSDELVLPGDEVEEKLLHIWKEILEIDTISVRDHFFEIGGHSLKAATMLIKINNLFGCQIPLRLVLENPTIEGMASEIKRRKDCER